MEAAPENRTVRVPHECQVASTFESANQARSQLERSEARNAIGVSEHVLVGIGASGLNFISGQSRDLGFCNLTVAQKHGGQPAPFTFGKLVDQAL